MAKDFLTDLEKRFAKNEKVETSTIFANLILIRYKGKANIREYIMEMSYLASKLKALNLELSEDLLVHLVLIYLPAQFSQFKVSFNYLKDSWSLSELISHYVQKEERFKQDRTGNAHLASTSKDKNKNNKRKKGKEVVVMAPQKKQHKEQTKDGCFFYRAAGHQKKQYTNYHTWHAKKGTLLNMVCSEVNLTSVPRHTWWIDFDATTHISVSVQSCRRSNDGERYIYIGDGMSVEVEVIDSIRLLLRIGYYLDLKDTFLYRHLNGIWFLF